MKLHRSLSRSVAVTCATAAMIFLAAVPTPLRAEDKSPAPTTQPVRPPVVVPVVPTTEPVESTSTEVKVVPLRPAAAATPPATPAKPIDRKAKISPDAQKVLDESAEAYGKLSSLDLAGKLTAEFDVAGETSDHAGAFTASFRAPRQFRHEMKDQTKAGARDDVLMGSTGEKVYVYKSSFNAYRQDAVDKEKFDLETFGPPYKDLLVQQNLSLAMRLSKDPVGLLVDPGDEVAKLADVKIGDQAFTALSINNKSEDCVVLFDAQTHLVRRVTEDLKKALEAKGQGDVKKAVLTLDYAQTKAAQANAARTNASEGEGGAVAKEEQYAWTPPPGSREAAAAGASGGDDEQGSPANALEGKPAPDFQLPGFDGKNVTLADQKGSVVVLDFWATWCGPCVAAMPHLEKLYQEKKAGGLKVFIVNMHEEPEKVQAFVKAKNLTMTVLLDTDQTKAAEKYLVQGIPQTVVIGKDGNVKKVFVGFNPQGGEEKLKQAIEAAMQ